MKTAPGVRITLPCLDVWERTETKLRQNYGCNRRAGEVWLVRYCSIDCINSFMFLLLTFQQSYKLQIFSSLQLCKTYSIINCIILQAIKAFCPVTRVDPSQFQNDGCNTAALTRRKKQNNTYMGQERQRESRRVKVRKYSLSAVLHVLVPGNSSLGITCLKTKWVFFSEWQRWRLWFKQALNSEDKGTDHSTAPSLSSAAKLRGDKSGCPFTTNADKEKQDVQKLLWLRRKPARALCIELLL